MNTDRVIAEAKDNEIIVTNLFLFSFPFIWYRLGDYVKLRERVACACKMEGPAGVSTPTSYSRSRRHDGWFESWPGSQIFMRPY